MRKKGTNKQQDLTPQQEIINNFRQNQKEIIRLETSITLPHSDTKSLTNYKEENYQQIENIEKDIEARDVENNRMSSVVANKIKELKGKIRDLKTEIKGVRQSIQDAEEKNSKIVDEINAEFNQKKEEILAESRKVEAELAHYAEWQRQADTYKSHLSELKSTIHHNRVICSENISETRQNAQSKIEKHRILLAEAIRQARAESLRLRAGDISNLTTTFLTQSEAHLKSLDSQFASSKQLSEVNNTIDDENISLQRDIDRLAKKKNSLKEQQERQKAVLSKLKTIREEFKERELQEKEMKKIITAREREEKRREEENRIKNTPKPKPEYKMTEEDEAFITFLNECATSVRSIIYDMLGENSRKSEIHLQNERFEAPKLSSMISEIKSLTTKLDEIDAPVEKKDESKGKPILTPAAAYFAFSAPFDESDNFVSTESWSFGKYEPPRPSTSFGQAKKPRIIRIRPEQKNQM